MTTQPGGHASAACDNCATPLAGHYCHACGQPAHNPLRSFAHAVEEVFESFWHLDGRIGRTLRDLLFPGRLPARFLRGHRAPYVPPLRLFVVLSVLTFFVAQYAVHVDSDKGVGGLLRGVQGGAWDRPELIADPDQFGAQTTVAAVEASREEKLAALREARTQVAADSLAARAMAMGERKLRADAQARLHQLDPTQPATLAAETDTGAGEPAERARAPEAPRPAGQASQATNEQIHIDALPGFANRWLNAKVARARLNLQRYSEDPGEFVHVFIAAIPSALFVLVPAFALLLKLCYLGSGRGYLEHLVVGLYSHAFLVLALLAMFVLMLIGDALPARAAWLAQGLGILRVLLALWLPVYLWLTQRRVYGESWWLTTLKYGVIGVLYFFLVGLFSLVPVLSSITH
ncbi:DUF3667 domain-containing protein [Pseudoxanthomonas sp. X-1]|uniref:DUF3667 domain-containing protein n=1 Tax=Pseudoxanthomonas sp. X-1 TaxID=2571115 RepID=UPI00110A445F|nr:DUF3667 domain-containing protein [Pseudoxanthomonas sp. X-1]TMN16713.1 DUF3667 domain-containing protein [Pseudoxanthomonas sp. X-1]UAY75499.1 DUF3667 domain-containing protein [Pseudoxanthomonas sp. X-1]